MGRMILIAWIAVVIPVYSFAQETVVLTDDQERYPLGHMLEYLKDSTGTLTLDDVLSPENQGRFIRSTKDVPSFGLTSSAYWVRIRLRSQAARTESWQLELGFPNMQEVTCFRPGGEGKGFDMVRTGTHHDFLTRNSPYHHFVFRIPLPQGTEQTLYLRLRNDWAMIFPLTLWTPEAFIHSSRVDYLQLGLVYGALILLIIYNLFLWLALKERNYGYYVGVLTCTLLGHMVYQGLAGQYLWPASPHLTDLGMLVLFPVISILGMLFAISFLDTRKRSPVGHRVILGFIGVWLVIMVLFIFVDVGRMVRVVMPLRLANSLVFTTINYLIWRKGYAPARYFFLAWLMTAMTFIPFALVRLGVLPSFSLAEQGIRFGMILTGLFFSFALADRIQNLQQEIFEHQKTQERLKIDKETAERSSEAKSRFLSMMSHEFRTPLNAILGYTDLLQRKPPMDSLMESGLKTIEKSGRHLLQLIEDLLDLAKIEAGTVELAPHAFSLTEHLDTVASMIRLRAHEKGLEFIWDPPPGLPAMVHGDVRRLRQVLLNLLGNAVKFTRKGRVRLDVIRQTDHGLKFSIEDTGPGIPPDQQEAIFSPFVQIRNARNSGEGAGLGLSLSRSMVALMGGSLHVDSLVGRGSTFWFSVDLPEVLDAEPVHAVENPSVVGYHGKPRSLLVVDDHPESRRMLTLILESRGFHVSEAANGKEAVLRVGHDSFDGVVMDLMMPVMDGREAARQMRQIPEHDHLKILLMTADASVRPETLRAESGCDAVLTKPINRDRLFGQLKAHLGLEWVYSDGTDVNAEDTPMVVPPGADLDTLRDLARIGAYTKLHEKLTQLRQQDSGAGPFVDHMLGLLHRFQFEAILEYLDQVAKEP